MDNDIDNIFGYGVGGTIQFLNGDIDVWGGYGFDISVGCSEKIPEFFEISCGFSAGLVFSAKPENPHIEDGKQITNQFLGFMFGLDCSQSLEPLTDLKSAFLPFLPECTISRSCGFIRQINTNKTEQLDQYAKCEVSGIDEVKKEWNSMTTKVRDDFASLMEKCRKAWNCRFDKCKNDYWHAGKEAGDCHDSRRKKCLDSHYIPGHGCYNFGKCISKDISNYWDATVDCVES